MSDENDQECDSDEYEPDYSSEDYILNKKETKAGPSAGPSGF